MLKNIIVFFTIYLYGSGASIVGDYHGLVFVQQSPVSAFLYLKKELQENEMSPTEISNYLKENATALMSIEPTKWIVKEFGATKPNDDWMVACRDQSGKFLKYKRDIPSEDFRAGLKTYWPSAVEGLTDNDVWRANYNCYGCCVKSTPLEYFQFAISLLNAYNIGGILEESNFNPSEELKLDNITNVITEKLKVVPYVKCLQLSNGSQHDQYLWEVQLCLNKESELIDCQFEFDNLCDTEKSIIYPKWE